MEIREEKETVITKIKQQVTEGMELSERVRTLEAKEPVEILEISFERWKATTSKVLERCFKDDSMAQKFILESSSFVKKPLANKVNKTTEIKLGLSGLLSKAVVFLQGLESDVYNGHHDPLDVPKSSKLDDDINRETAIIVIRRMLANFHKHINVMYREPIHRNGKLKQEDLNRIQIGNEYDVQRMLYGIIKPVFPQARTEVVGDAEYKSVRFDIKLDKYNIIIEVKCTRNNMSDKKLAEELASDCYLYPSDCYLFLFVYDKEQVISNTDAFIGSFTKEMGKDKFDKEIETIVLQSILL